MNNLKEGDPLWVEYCMILMYFKIVYAFQVFAMSMFYI